MRLRSFIGFDANHQQINFDLLKISDDLYRIKRGPVTLHEFDNVTDAKIKFINLQIEITGYAV